MVGAGRLERFLRALKILTRDMPQPMCTFLAQKYDKDPFVILIACLLSLRTRDTSALPVVEKLLVRARDPRSILDITQRDLEKMVFSLGFYHQKARTMRVVCQELIDRFGGKVPDNFDALVSLTGVGGKTANLVLAESFDVPALAVDTHVHRLANKWGLVATKTPEQTELALKKIVPQKHWREINRLMVMCGQNKCDVGHLLHF